MAMSIKTVGIMVAVVIAALVTAGIMATGLTSSVFAQEQKFMATLSGQEEVPPTNSQATGMAEFTVMGADSVQYNVNATNIQGVTAGHIHSGKQGENGPVVVTLFKYDSPMNQVSETGSITADKLEGPMAGKQLSDLATAMNNGETYVNIHTEANPNGEIRGQIMSSSSGATMAQ
jgi:CHRD domain